MTSPPPLRTLELLRRLKESKVEFVIIGGVAAITHGSAVTTEDLDVCAPLSDENAQRIIRAFSDAGPRWRMRPDLPVITTDSHQLTGLKNMYLATDFGQLDIWGEVPEVCTYTELAARAVDVDFDGVPCRLIDIDTLIAAKRRIGRANDLQTISFLEQIKKHKRRLKASLCRCQGGSY